MSIQNNILTRHELERIAKQPVIYARLLGKATIIKLVNTARKFWEAQETIRELRRKVEMLEKHLNG